MHLNLIDTPIRPNPLDSTTPTNPKRDKTPLAPPSILRYSGERFGQPNVRLIPDLTQTYYNTCSPDFWNQRAVLAANKYHILITQSKEEHSIRNVWLNALVSGDVLILKLSDTASEDGTWSYQDILPNETEEEIQKVMFECEESRYQWMADLNAAL